MGKIVKIKTKTDNVNEFLDQVKEFVTENNIDNMMIVCKLNDKSVSLGYTKNLDWGTKQELLGHIQIDIVKDMINQNYIT